MRIYNQLGWLETSDEGGARETCQRHPDEWMLHPWIRPDGTPNVNIPHDWPQQPGARRIDLARQIKGGDQNGETPVGLGITDSAAADQIIRGYLDGTKHPEVK